MLTTQKNFDVFAVDEASPEAARALAASQVPQLIERVFTDQHGRQFRMVFMVAVVDGELRGKLVSVQALEKRLEIRGKSLEKNQQDSTLFLPSPCSNIQSLTSYLQSPALFVSPYVSLESLITSQPTRAPSFS